MLLKYEVHDSILGVIAAFACGGDAKKWCDKYNQKVGSEEAKVVDPADWLLKQGDTR